MSFHPQTPQSPSQFSPSTTDLFSNPAGSMTSSVTTLPTPAHSVNGSSAVHPEMPHDAVMADDSPHKRKRPIDDIGDREQKKAHIEDRSLGIENLHLDVGEKYLLCRTQHKVAYPNSSEDLFKMFGLTDIAASVAREFPNGEKNALRKTYKGQIKSLGITGHFDSVKKERGDPNGILALLEAPEMDWYSLMVKGKEIEDGLSRQAESSLHRAMNIVRGPVPKQIWDSSVLGDLSGGMPGKLGGGTKSAAPSTTGTPNPHASTKLKHLQSHDPARTKRNFKKRGYGDDTFEGYGEGFPDDDMGLETGYSTGEGDERGLGQKRRKKNHASSQLPPRSQQGGYGPGLVGA